MPLLFLTKKWQKKHTIPDYVHDLKKNNFFSYQLPNYMNMNMILHLTHLELKQQIFCLIYVICGHLGQIFKDSSLLR